LGVSLLNEYLKEFQEMENLLLAAEAALKFIESIEGYENSVPAVNLRREIQNTVKMLWCVCDAPDIRSNGQVIMCFKCGHAPRYSPVLCRCGKPADRDGVQCDKCYIRENT
jgi:hypothetical protein